MNSARIFALSSLVALCAACRSEPPQAVTRGPYQASQRDALIVGGPYTLRGALFIPNGEGPFPAVVYNHGSERDPSLEYMGATARWFQEQGFVALFPYRRGSNGSEGPFWEDEVGARQPDEREYAMVEALDAQSVDVMAAVAWLAEQPEVDPKRIVVAGCSFGGILSVLAAEQGDNVRASISFAGASITWAQNKSLRERMQQAVRAARAPIFFVQAENDFNTAPTVELSAEMAAAGLPHDKKIFPPHGTTPMEGHAHFCNFGQAEWGPDVLAFLDKWGVDRGRDGS